MPDMHAIEIADSHCRAPVGGFYKLVIPNDPHGAWLAVRADGFKRDLAYRFVASKRGKLHVNLSFSI